MESQFTTLMTFTLPHEMAFVKSYLEAEGVECFAMDELTIQGCNLYSNTLNGCKLKVRTPDVERAVQILRDGGFIPGAESAGEFSRIENPATETNLNQQPHETATNVERCPFCGSDNVSIKRLSIQSMWPFLLSLPPIPIFSHKRHCYDCNKNFKKGDTLKEQMNQTPENETHPRGGS